jgi:two-component system, OmpR family, sensor histidine kinase VicK
MLTLIVIIVVVALVLVGTGVGIFLVMSQKSKADPADNHVKQLKGALASKDIQAEILIESISDGIVVTDSLNHITLFNKAASAISEWPVDEALGIEAQTVLPLLADEKTNALVTLEEHPLTRATQQQQPIHETVQLIGRTNKRTFISLSISPIINPKNNEFYGSVAVFRDVSQEKSEEQQRADFVSTASHEMRTPVAAIEGYLSLALNQNVSQIDAHAREYLEKAHASTEHLGKLFQDLLTSAKAEDGRLTSHPVVVELGAFVEQLVEDLRFTAEKKGLQVELLATTTGSSDTTSVIDARGKVIQPFYYVHVDPDRLREVVTNLFDNAVKYTPDGKVSLGVTGNDEVVQIRVRDTGPGIPANDLPHLFQKFYRVDNSATRTIGGTGLGLFICRKIIELYSGVIWAESELGKGSTFYINLPRISTQRAHQLQETEKASTL